jgi:tellurite resistance protein TerC
MMLWIGFLVLIVACLALDLGAFHQRHRDGSDISLAEAGRWTAIWIGVGVAFSGIIYVIYQWGVDGRVLHTPKGFVPHDGAQAALLYLTAYLLEKSLSIDNLFVITLVFSGFRVPRLHQHRVLRWGILGAILMRGAMIGGGLMLIQRFSWLFYLFGLYLAYSGIKLMLTDEDEAGDGEPEPGTFERLARKVLPVSAKVDGDHFFTRIDGKLFVTPLLLCLLVVEATDVIFAVDSVPAVLGISVDPFICYTSNIFAVLGLRSLYFVLAGLMARFQYLKHALALVLIFIGAKLFCHHWIALYLPQRLSIALSLGFILVTMTVGIAWSWKKSGDEEAAP